MQANSFKKLGIPYILEIVSKNLENHFFFFGFVISNRWIVLCRKYLFVSKLNSARNSCHQACLALNFFCVLKKVFATLSITIVKIPPQTVRILEPKGFGGSRNAKELENFQWDMKQFFKAAHVPNEEMVSITSMYLSGDAKLWWRTRMRDYAESGRPQINIWETLKRELKEQFLPPNSAWLVRESLK